MAKVVHKTTGTCSTEIRISVERGVIRSIRFKGGCPGNVRAVARLAAGRRVREVVKLLGGIRCRNGTSCPDQLARALKGLISRGGRAP